MLTGPGAAGASALISPSAEAALPDDRVKVVHYYSSAGMLINSRPDGSFMNW